MQILQLANKFIPVWKFYYFQLQDIGFKWLVRVLRADRTVPDGCAMEVIKKEGTLFYKM